MADKFTFFASYYEAIEELDDKTRLKVYDMICRYALYGEIIESENPIEKSLFTIIKPFIDSSEKRRSGGAPLGNKNAKKKKQPIETTENNIKQPIETTIETTETNNKNKNKNKNMNMNMNMKENIGEYCQPNVNQLTTKCQPIDNQTTAQYSIDKVSIDKVNNIGDKKRKRFIPPTLSEVQAYCKERNNNVDAETFVNFYQSKDWYVGKNKMKDWKAAVRTWENKSRQENKQQEPESDADLDKYRMLVNQF